MGEKGSKYCVGERERGLKVMSSVDEREEEGEGEREEEDGGGRREDTIFVGDPGGTMHAVVYEYKVIMTSTRPI